MIRMDEVTIKTEIRHLPAEIVAELCNRLNYNDTWKKLIKRVPVSAKDPTALYTVQHVDIIQRDQDPSQAFLNDWGTHGRLRPTVELLIKLLCDSELYRIADYLAVDVLRGDPVSKDYLSTTQEIKRLQGEESPNSSGYHDVTSTSNTSESGDVELSKEELSDLKENIKNRIHLVPYRLLRESTDDFNNAKLKDGGKKIGSGAFSEVFLGIHNGVKIAVKRQKINCHNEFVKEVDMLTTHQHKNIIRLLAASVGELHLCLVCEYMVNGALQDRLACVDKTSPIPWRTRLQIALDVSEALVFLHDRNHIHRDLKSANILLANDWVAKLGDFGIAHLGPDLKKETSLVTERIIGTSVYMPMDAFNGVITSKLDTYSFGVVLLELLTGCPPYNPLTQDILIEIVVKNCSAEKSIEPLLDKKAGSWDVQLANLVFGIATKCLESFRNNRPFMTEVLKQFKDLLPQ